MSSTSSSSVTGDNSTILNVEQLDVCFHVDIHGSTALRDSFVSFIKSPLKKIFEPPKQLKVISGLNLKVKRGEKVGILGLNGAGKTTLCRAIAGMYQGTAGKITVNGTVRSVFDTTVGVIPELTGRENAELLCDLIYPHLSKAERTAVLADALEFSELGDFLDVAFLKYSKGMQVRLCLSIISARPCDLLILDEVFDGADAFFQKKISKRILNLIEESGAVLFVSHAPDQIRLACNRVAVLADRKIIFDGPVEEGIRFYYNRYRDLLDGNIRPLQTELS